TDPDVLALDQDPLGHQARRVRTGERTEVWARPLADGSTAVALLNRTDTTIAAATTAEEAGAPEADGYTLFDVWAKTTTTTEGPISASVPPHGAAIFRVLPQN
ncbi:MAG: alpha-galactosidase, partial [Pseudonocardiales bacterium]|nr:alpha-galactosidase [Pseudonocardiales bacterium]